MDILSPAENPIWGLKGNERHPTAAGCQEGDPHPGEEEREQEAPAEAVA